jgi:CubicO group peptidase (beta-lactamase class C family)
MKNIFYLLTIALLFVNCKKNTVNQYVFAEYDNYLKTEVDEGRLVGVQGIVFENGNIVYEKSYGMRDRESADSMKGNELYFIQSMTKPIVSVALMTLYDEGKFSLDDPISNFLPEFSNIKVVNDPTVGTPSGTYISESPITIRQILSHTSGMSHGIAPIEFDKEIWNSLVLDPNIKTLGDRVTALSKLPLMWEPGSKWNYSFSPDVVGRLVEVISGKDLSTYLKEKIFEPLGMDDTGYNLTEEQQKRVMVVYEYTSDSTIVRTKLQPTSHDNILYSGVNALFSSAKDYLSFASMLLNKGELNGKRILNPETVDLIIEDHTAQVKYRLKKTSQFEKLANGIVTDSLGTLNLEPGHHFGLGLAVLNTPSEANRTIKAEGEFFWSGANSTYFFVNPSKNLIGIFMTQVASVGTPNPYGFYFGDQMRTSIYKGVK